MKVAAESSSIDVRNKVPRKITFETNILYKTVMCKEFMEHGGQCPREQKCQFAHGKADLRDPRSHPIYKTSLCRQFLETKQCPRGNNCYHAHNVSELKTRIRRSTSHQNDGGEPVASSAAPPTQVSDGENGIDMVNLLANGHFPVIRQSGDDVYFTLPKSLVQQLAHLT
jgi:hypothetical protein